MVALTSIACSLVVDTSGLTSGVQREDGSAPSGDGAVEASDGEAQSPDADATTDAPAPDRYFDEVMSDGPVAYFRLSDPAPATAAKNEVAGSSITAIYQASGITHAAPGALSSSDRAIHFDAADGSFTVFGAGDWPGDVPFTLEAWVELDDFSGTGLVTDMTYIPGPGTGWLLFVKQAPQPEFRSELWTDGEIKLYAQHHTTVSTATFHHVVLLHSDVDHIDHLVIDGTASDEGEVGNGSGARKTNSVDMKWGGFRGTLDEVAIYDKALSGERIAKHMLAR